MSPLFALVAIYILSGISVAVESPLETISSKLGAIETQIHSVQKTIVNSVSLMQDQFSDLSKEVTSKLESRLTSVDMRLGALDGKLSEAKDKSEVVDSLQQHKAAWNSRVNSLDHKINHLTRSQNEKLREQSVQLGLLPHLQMKLSAVSGKLDEVGIRVETFDTGLKSLQDKQSGEDEDVLAAMEKMEALVRNISRSRGIPRERRHRQKMIPDGSSGSSHKNVRHSCRDNREILEDIQAKVDVVYEKSSSLEDDYSNDLSSGNGPRFDYLRAQPSSSDWNYDLDPELSDPENQFVKTLRKMATPLKKANKRLKDMEEMQRRAGNIVTELERSLRSSLATMENKLTDLYTMSGEMFEQQNSQMERYSANFAEILQCCQGHSGDFERFRASGAPVLANMDSWMVTWTAEANQKFDRVLDQLRFNTNRLVTGHKQLERIMVEGLDECQGGKVEVARRGEGTTKHTTAHLQTTTQPIVLEEDLFQEDVVEAEEESESMDHIEVEQYNDEIGDPAETVFNGCEDLRMSGEIESKVFTVGQTRQMNELQRDFNTRFCDQETSGGGWTVIQRRGDFGSPRVNFSRPWLDYKHGFGDLYGEFWFGNDYMSKLSRQQNLRLRIDLEAHNGTTATAEYTTFRVDGESSSYRLWVGGYSGNATDSLSNHNGYKFSTIDRNNDQAPQCCPCAPAYGGGWWFYSCFESNLNGEYFEDPLDNGYYRGIIWELWLGDYSLKSAKMMVRPLAWSHVVPVPPDP